MVDRDTASRCRSLARVWPTARHLAVTATATLGLLLAVLLPAAVAQAHGCTNARTPIAAASRHQLQDAVVCLINQQRSRHHLPPLHGNKRLNRSAQGWTNTMVRHGAFSHGSDFAARITAVGFDWSRAGENIATGFGTPAAVVSAWMASTGHCREHPQPVLRRRRHRRQPARDRRGRQRRDLDPGLRTADGPAPAVGQQRPGQRLPLLIGAQPAARGRPRHLRRRRSPLLGCRAGTTRRPARPDSPVPAAVMAWR